MVINSLFIEANTLGILNDKTTGSALFEATRLLTIVSIKAPLFNTPGCHMS